MDTSLRKKYPLQVTISTLFILISIILGLVISLHSFYKTSDIMLNSAHDIYQRISQELTLDFQATYGPLAGGLRQFRLSPVIKAKTFDERIANIEDFDAVLASGSAVFGVGIGYANGDYLGIASVDSDYVRQKYTVPAAASLVALYVKNGASEPGFDAGKSYSIFFDDQLNEIFRNTGETSQFDPRLRPWYQQATEIPAATKPYLFYDSKVVGLTAMSKTAEPGVVVVFDITLKNLSQTIAKYQMTQSSEVVLINAEGQVYAYKDQRRVFVDDAESSSNKAVQLANLDQLGSRVLSFVAKNIKAEERVLSFEYDGRDWIGSARIVAKPGGVDLYALILSPVDELLVDAVAIRTRSIFIALIILLIFIPVIWFVSKKISTPLNILSHEAEAISRFDFSESQLPATFIKEVDQLDAAMESMKSTISKFIKLINSLAGEQDLDLLLKSITDETMQISQSDAALIYLLDEQDDRLKADFMCAKKGEPLLTEKLPVLDLDDARLLVDISGENGNGYKSRVIQLSKGGQNKLTPLLNILGADKLTSIVLPLQNRNNEIIGLLCLIYKHDEAIDVNNIRFIEALSGFAAVTLESRQLFNMQEALLQAFIELIAGAIDAKSPYTGGHCARVPEITLMLAKAACDIDHGMYKDFDLDEKQWKELSIAGWLHDCGKVTTPEYVVDKATKLETIYDRIHEVRTRFEVMKRDAEIECWKQIADGADKDKTLTILEETKRLLDEDFAFVAECNVGGEFMADDKIERLQLIAEKTWMRTLDDSLGLSWEELNRKQSNNEQPATVQLPVTEKLLSDKAEHLIARHDNDKMSEQNQWGFKVDTPEYKYNRGELYNLSVKKGTLSDEERYMINGHMIQTIIMLNNLPYPKNLRDVPLIAGSHHETMDGKGYPKKLVMTEQPLTARMMVIADIFEALTASDRPYKKAKSLSESLRILSFMRNDKHIDPDLFDLFLSSGVYLEYAKKFLSADQIDEVNIEDYLS